MKHLMIVKLLKLDLVDQELRWDVDRLLYASQEALLETHGNSFVPNSLVTFGRSR